MSMKDQMGNRIKSPWVIPGLLLWELFELINCFVNYNAVSKYEHGEMIP